MIIVAAMFIGGVLIMAGINDQLSQLGSLTKDLIKPANGSSGFFLWLFAIVFIGALLRMLNLPEAGKALIVLIMVAYILGHHDIPGQIMEGVKRVGGSSDSGGPAAAGTEAPPGGTDAAPRN